MGKLIRSSFNANSCIEVGNSLTYPLAPASLSLRLDGTIRKSCQSTYTDTCFLNLAAHTNIIERLCHNSRFSMENTLKNYQSIWNSIYIFGDTSNEKKIKHVE